MISAINELADSYENDTKSKTTKSCMKIAIIKSRWNILVNTCQIVLYLP